MEFLKYPSIESFRHVVAEIKRKAEYVGKDENGKPIYDENLPKPTIVFSVQTKLHGTNGCVVVNRDGEIAVQSRNRFLSYQSDNCGFYAWVMERKEAFLDIAKSLFKWIEDEFDTVYIYGEFAGKNVQKGTAISELEKSFFIFDAVTLNSREKTKKNLVMLKSQKLYNIFNVIERQDRVITIVVDFNHPENSIDTIEKFTQEVEDRCPVAASFGIDGIGEGIVCKGYYGNDVVMFKSKGEKYKVTKVNATTTAEEVDLTDINEFVEATVTDNRLNQGLDYLREMDKPILMKSAGDFIKWVMNDVFKEEADIIAAKKLNIPNLKKEISKKAIEFFKVVAA